MRGNKYDEAQYWTSKLGILTEIKEKILFAKLINFKNKLTNLKTNVLVQLLENIHRALKTYN